MTRFSNNFLENLSAALEIEDIFDLRVDFGVDFGIYFGSGRLSEEQF